MDKKKYIILCCIVSLLFGGVKAQDIAISQYYSNVVYLNPAFAGIHPNSRVNFHYRNQWLSAESGFQSYGATFDTRIEKINSGLGFILSNESAGVVHSPSIDAIYTYGFELFRGFYVNVALQAGVVQRYQQAQDIKYMSDGESSSSGYLFEEQGEVFELGFTKLYADFAAGGVFFYKDLYGGVVLDHIAKPYLNESNIFGGSKVQSARLNRKLTLHIGYLKYLNTRLLKQIRVLAPSLLIQWQGFQQNITWGSSFQYDNLIGGIWMRHNTQPNFDALIFSFGIKTKEYRIAYSYDMNIGKKVGIPAGAHELSFTMFVPKNKNKNFSGIKTPTFLQ